MTTKCKCTKETELAEMQTDIKWIRKALEGNGEKGLINNTNLNTEFRLQFKGFIAAIVLITTMISSGVYWVLNKFGKM